MGGRRAKWLILLALAGVPGVAAHAGNDAQLRPAESSVPGSAAAGATFAVRIRVYNSGSTTWTTGSLHRLGAWYSDSFNQVNWSGFPCGGYMNSPTDGRVFLCSDVPPAASYDFNFNVTIPSGASGSVRLAVRMVQDGVEWFGQTYAWSISVGGNGLPDVVVESVAVSPPNPSPGQQISFTSVVQNVGSAATPAGVVIGVGYFIDGAYKTWGAVNGPLAAGASVTIGTQGGTWTATSGNHTATALADDVNRFAESNENNNSGSVSFTVGSGGLPDVVVDSVAVSPANPAPGQQVSFTSVVRNTGSAATPAGVVIGVGYFVDGAYKTWGAVNGPLAAGASVAIGTQGGTWTATAGNHTVTALADDVNRFSESNESNNSGSSSFTVGSGPPPTASLYGMNIDPANPAGNPSAEQLKDIGVRWVRIEWKASHGYSHYDPILAAYRNAGLRVLLLLDYTTVSPKPASNAGDAEWRSYLSSFIAKVREIASHYGDGVDAWQIWNEQDLFAPGTAYDPGVPAHHFGTMLRDSVSAIRPYSTRPIVTGGHASGDASYLRRARDAAGGLTVNAVAVHPYGQRAPDNWPYPTWGFGNMSDLFNRYLVFGLPLWVTEIGTVDEPLQPDYLENVYELARDSYAGRVPVVFWFCWSDGMVPPFGLVDRNGNPKPAYFRYQAIATPWSPARAIARVRTETVRAVRPPARRRPQESRRNASRAR